MSKYLDLVDGSFTQEHFDKQQTQIPYVAYSVQDDEVIYNIVPNENGTMYTVYKVVSKDISNCTYNMVDLGLSVKWADRNVGATSPEHYGSYFQWGDTDAYTYDGVGEVTAAELAKMLNSLFGSEDAITTDNVGMMVEQGMGIVGTDITSTGLTGSLDKEFDWESYFDTTDNGSTFNKYNNNGGLTVLESSDDAATVHMSSQYRMPTIDEIRELVNNTTQTFIDLDGNEYIKGIDVINIERGKLKGVRFTGSNGNNIFIPAAGGCIGSLRGSSIGGYCGGFWSSNLYDDSDDNARYLFFRHGNEIDVNEGNNYRYYGIPVRGVYA